MRLRALAVSALCVVCSGSVNAGAGGREAFVFTSLAGDARGAALGIGAAALLDGEGAAWGNPAAAPLQLQYTAGLTHVSWTDGFFGETLTAMLPVGEEAVVGIGGFLFLHDPVPVTSEVLPEGTGALVRPLGVEASLLGASFIVEGLSAGASLRVVHEQFGDTAIEGMALDLGSVWMLDPTVAVGFAMRGFGGALLSRAVTDPFPLSFDGSVRYEAVGLLPMPVKAYAGASLPVWGPSGGGIAVEVGDWYGAFLRGMVEMREYDGFGWAIGIGGRRDQWNVDYTFAPVGELGFVHRVGLTLKFSKSLTPGRGY